MILDHFSWLDRVRWYTRPHQQALREDWLRRERTLAMARELERVAAEFQRLADELREAM